ncbi:MAG: ABC transporter ATP-binding protein [Cyanobacteria bacterium RM1_2_2]|nr:ABC transporter ATP-binding protein [Cyanobacteria bacterium RM1_2_2]
MLILEASHLQKNYRSQGKTVAAVRDVSLNIAEKEVLAFLGPNGAGKTTSIKMIAGLILPDAGQVRIVGRDPHRDACARRSIGAVLEGNRNVYWRLTPEENLTYFGVLRGLSQRTAHQRAKTLLERFELTEKRRSLVQTLSRGMQQKLAIAVALIHDPQLLLLDEPTLGLDVEATQSVKRLVREIAAEGRAILLTTHQLDIAEELSDRVAIINGGEVVVEEPTTELIRQFSNAAYTIELEHALDSVRLDKISRLDVVIKHEKIYVNQLKLVYEILEIVRPLPFVQVVKDQASLEEIFLKLVQENRMKC